MVSTPLLKKLGIRENTRLLPVNPPSGFLARIDPLPAGAIIVADPVQQIDVIILFVQQGATLRAQLPLYRERLAPAGVLWVAWPKKTGRIATDLDFEAVQLAGVKHGLVDTSIGAVDERWSAIRFVVRGDDRSQAATPGERSAGRA